MNCLMSLEEHVWHDKSAVPCMCKYGIMKGVYTSASTRRSVGQQQEFLTMLV
jgi:hypothetical protein